MRGLVDGRIERHGEPPASLSEKEYYGRRKTIVDVRSDLNELADGDLQLLLEWSVRAYREGGTPRPPQTAALRQLNLEAQQKQLSPRRFLSGLQRWFQRAAILTGADQRSREGQQSDATLQKSCLHSPKRQKSVSRKFMERSPTRWR